MFTAEELRMLEEADREIEGADLPFDDELDGMLEDLAMETIYGAVDYRKMKAAAEYKRQYREQNKEAYADKLRVWRDENREKYNAYMREYLREYRKGIHRKKAEMQLKGAAI